MTDARPEIRQNQLEIWLAKTPAERLRITLENNDDLYYLWDALKKNNAVNDLEKVVKQK